MDEKDGGPAFPVGSGDMRDPMGITLRDYFAGQALAGSNANPACDTLMAHQIAELCYKAADAMLAARK